MKLNIEEITNGYIVTGDEGKTYREKAMDALTQAQVVLDGYRKELLHPSKEK